MVTALARDRFIEGTQALSALTPSRGNWRGLAWSARSSSMNSEGEPRGRRRSSFQLLADAVGATNPRVAPDDADARRRDAPDPTLTEEEEEEEEEEEDEEDEEEEDQE